jgi:hypothetical protein
MLDQGIGARESMLGLNCAEQFIVWSIRRIVTERGPDARLLDECESMFGEESEIGFRVLSVFLGLLGRAARRSFLIGTPELMAITWSEKAILALLAAAQFGDGELLAAHLRLLAKPAVQAELAVAAGALAGLLAQSGHRIALAEMRRPSCDAPLALVPQAASGEPLRSSFGAAPLWGFAAG